MKTKKCGEGAICWLHLKITQNLESWCSYLLPCNRCIAPFNLVFCKHTEENFDCDNCQHKFLCLTCNDASWQKEISEN